MVREMKEVKKPSNLDRFDYYETNKAAILADSLTLTRKQVCPKYGIPGSSLGGLLRRWGETPARKHRGGPASDGSTMPADKLQRLAWLEGYYQALQDERRHDGR